MKSSSFSPLLFSSSVFSEGDRSGSSGLFPPVASPCLVAHRIATAAPLPKVSQTIRPTTEPSGLDRCGLGTPERQLTVPRISTEPALRSPLDRNSSKSGAQTAPSRRHRVAALPAASFRLRYPLGISGLREKAYGRWNATHGRWNVSHRGWNVACDGWNRAHGRWNISHCGWNVTCDCWNRAHGRWKAAHHCWNVTHDCWKLIHGCWKATHDCWGISHGHWDAAHDRRNATHAIWEAGHDSWNAANGRWKTADGSGTVRQDRAAMTMCIGDGVFLHRSFAW